MVIFCDMKTFLYCAQLWEWFQIKSELCFEILRSVFVFVFIFVLVFSFQSCFGNVEWKAISTEKRTKMVNPTQRLNTAILRSTKKIQVVLDGTDVLGAR